MAQVSCQDTVAVSDATASASPSSALWARADRSVWVDWLLVGMLLLVYVGLATSSMAVKGNAFDEMSHLTAGVSYWRTGDYRLNSEQGAFPQRWAALPVHLGRFAFPSLDQQWWRISNEWALGQQFFFELGNDLQHMLFVSRLMIVLLGVVLGLIVYVWSRAVFGRVGGFVSLTLYCLSPTILAHTQLVTSDAAAALTMTAAIGAFCLATHRLSPGTAALACVATAALFLSKASAIVYMPMAVLLAAVRLVDGRPIVVGWGRPRHGVVRRATQAWVIAGVVALQGLVVWVSIWGAFGFRYEAMREPEPGRDRLFMSWEELLSDRRPTTRMIGAVRAARLLPEAYMWGLAFHSRTTEHNRVGFLNGEYSTEGWWTFFPYCLMVKTPLPLFILLGLGAAGTVVLWLRRAHGLPSWTAVRQGSYATAPLWILLAVYWVAVLGTKLNIGHRHLLITYPAMFILAGSAAAWLKISPRWAVLLVGAPLAWLAVDSAMIWPHYLSYFNGLAGGPRNGYRHLVDSSVDWGQDLPLLKQSLDEQELRQPGHPPVYLLYFGSGDPQYYGLDVQLLPGVWGPAKPTGLPEPLRAGTYCISVTQLQGVYSTPAIGPWCEPYERQYQYYRRLWNEYQKAQDSVEPSQRRRLLARFSEESWHAQLMMWQELRAARLCAYLRQHRERPDDRIGYSIHLYRLSEQEVREAIDGPPPQPFYAAPQIKGRMQNAPRGSRGLRR